MEKIVYIYGLVDPRTDEVRYIGWTPNTKRRLRDHINQSKYEKNHKANWIKSLLKQNLKPHLIILQEVPDDQWSIAEKAWIRYGREEGWELTNATDGGEGTPGLKPRLGMHNTDEANKKIGLAHKNKKISLETREKLRIAQTGRRYSTETIQKMRDTRSGENNGMFGKHHSEKTKEKIRIKSIGHKRSVGNNNANARLTEEQVIEIRHRASNGEKQRLLSKEYDVSESRISAIVSRKTWKHIP